MNRHTFVLGLAFVLAALVASVTLGGAAIVCVGPTATGNGSGTDWNNQAAWSSITFIRGSTNYVADGSYGSKTLSTPQSGSTYIVVKKATVSEHGPDTGWISTNGDGQAVIDAVLKFNSGYWIFDGQTRNENDWFDGAAYGFQVTHNNQDQNIVVGGGAVAPNITIKYVYVSAIVGNLPSTTTIRRYAIDTYTGDTFSNTGYVFHKVFVNGSNNPLFLNKSIGTVVEYCATDQPQCNAANHATVVNLYFGADNAVIRYNNFRRSFTTGGVGGTVIIGTGQTSGTRVYGNIFDRFLVGDAALGFDGYWSNDNLVYNNTFLDGFGTDQGCKWGKGTGNNEFNNLWINCPNVTLQGTHDYNAFSSSSSLGEAHEQLNVPTSIFVNYAGGDFRLALPTAAGVSLPAFSSDPLGTSRGRDGSWDRGAFEFDESRKSSVVAVSPAVLRFGSMPVNTTRDLKITVQNVGIGTLAGVAKVAAPFSIVSGGTYNLGANQSQTVTVRWSPVATGSNWQSFTFTGGGGAIAEATGISTP